MASKKPDDDFSNDKDDIDASLEDLDLDSLLSDEKKDKDKDKHEAMKHEAIIDEGELDLLADDDKEALEISTADLLDGGNNGSMSEPGDPLPGEGGGVQISPDDVPTADLLSDNDLDAAMEPRAGGGSEASEEAASPSKGAPSIHDAPTAPLPTEAEKTAASPASSPKGSRAKRKLGQPKLRRGLTKTGKKEKRAPQLEGSEKATAESGESTVGEEETKSKKQRREKAEKPEKIAKEPARPAAATAVRSTSGSLTFICSECYEEFLLPSNFSQEMVSCPECLHVGKRPEEDFLRTVALHKGGEKKSFLAAVATGAVVVLMILTLLWLKLPGSNPPESAIVIGLLGATTLGAALFLWFLVRYEGNRWEVYF